MEKFLQHYFAKVGLQGLVDDIKILDRVGISSALNNYMMDPAFTDIRRTQPVEVWAEEFVTSNVLSLRKLASNLTTRFCQLIGEQPMPGMRGGAGKDGGRKNYYLSRPGHDTLYRATTMERITQVFGDQGEVVL